VDKLLPVHRLDDRGIACYDIGTVEVLTKAARTQLATPLYRNWCHPSDKAWALGWEQNKLLPACIEGVTHAGKLPPVDASWLPERFQGEMRRGIVWGVGAGAAWNMAALMSGAPRYAMKFRPNVREAPVITIVASCAYSASVPAEDLLDRAAQITALVRDLQATGRGVEVIAEISGAHSPLRSVRVRVKDAMEPVDTARLLWWLGHPAASRMLFYPTCELLAGTSTLTDDEHEFGWSAPVDPVRWPDDLEGTVYLKCVHATARGGWRKNIQAAFTAGIEAVLGENDVD
jgi:hypothetical protein